MNRWRVWAIAGAAVVLVGAGVELALHLRGGSQATSYTEIVTVQRGNLVATITPTGEVSAERRADLSFDVTRIPLIELDVAAGQEVKQGDVLARIDTEELQRAVDQAEADALSAEEALAEAKDPYTDLDLQKAELDVANAQVALDQAKQGTNADALARAKSNLESAQLNYTITLHSAAVGKTVRDLAYTEAWHERELRDLENRLQQGTTDQAAVDAESATLAEVKAQLAAAQANSEATLAAAQDKVDAAQKALDDLQSGDDSVTQRDTENKVAQAAYNLAKAQENLATIQAGPDPKAVQLAQAKYESAQATLEDAKATLESATMVAPFDGTVLSVGAEVGDLVSTGTTVVTLADLSNLQVTATVDETDISQVQVGDDAQITFDAFAGQTFQGKVLEVPLEGTLSQNVVTYDVLLSLEGAENVALRSGMTANVTIVIGRRQNVLLVPTLAIRESDQGSYVVVQASANVTVDVPVQLGLSNGTYTEVTSGLQEGDKVVVEYQATSNQTNRFGGFGGAMPGGGFISGGRTTR
jgi:HlyD family secretion protein